MTDDPMREILQQMQQQMQQMISLIEEEIQPTNKLVPILPKEIQRISDLRDNLSIEYDQSAYEHLERDLIDHRRKIKGKLQDITDPDYEFVNRSEARRNLTEQTVQNFTRLAEKFQEAREKGKLDRPRVTDAIEDVVFNLKNLNNLVREPVKDQEEHKNKLQVILSGLKDLKNSMEVLSKNLQKIPLGEIFISYSHSDEEFVDKLERQLSKQGIRFWRDIHDMKSGRIETQIDQAIRHNNAVLLILSKASLESDWVEHEVRQARALEKERKKDVLCPIALDNSWKNSPWAKRIMEQIMEFNILDFSEWQDDTKFEGAFNKLIGGLELFYK